MSMDFERIWLQAVQIGAAAKYIMKIDRGERRADPRDAMVDRLKNLIAQFIEENGGSDGV